MIQIRTKKVSIIEPVGGHGGMDYYDYGLSLGLGYNDVNVLYYTCDKTQVRDFKNVNTILVFKKVWGTSILNKTYRYITGHYQAFRDGKKKGINLVHLHFFVFRIVDYIVLILAKTMKFKIIVTVHDVNGFDKKASQLIEHYCYSLIDGIIVHNESSERDLRIKNVPIKRMAIIPHGNYTPFITKLPYNETNNVFTLLFFGQIKKVKGLDILLKAVKLVTEKNYKIRLIVAGKAWKSDLNYYMDLIDQLDIREDVATDFRYIPDEEVASFYSPADLVVLPYTEIYQSGVLLLTMSYGRPVLCSNLNAFKEIVFDGETGFLFQNKNEEDLANKIIHIIQNKSILPNIIKNANTLMESKYNWKNIGKMTLDFYNSL